MGGQRLDGTTRRGLLAAFLGGGTATLALSPARSYLERFAPPSGRAWRRSHGPGDPGTVGSPRGDATLRYDDEGVAHVTAGDDRALYFAVGYAHGRDRLFQLDLQRRLMRGELAAAVGEVAIESDRFHRKMDFLGATRATWEQLADSRVGPLLEAYAEGVNAAARETTLPLEFGLVGHDPGRWRPVDTLLMERLIAWRLTGDYRTLHVERARRILGPERTERLYPTRMDHDEPILRTGERQSGARAEATPDGPEPGEHRDGTAIDPDLLSWLDRFGTEPGVGSNSWVVSGEHTESGAPILANDPHLDVSAPPVWYEQNLRTDGFRVRGVAFPGSPFVTIGENHAGAWGFTNTGADVIDFYSYETDGDRRYRYRGEWRSFDARTETIRVADGPDQEVTVRKSVHGPVFGREALTDRDESALGMAWTGLTATETSLAIDGFARSDGVEEFRSALERMDLPTQNVVYADRDGETLLHVSGKIPVRTVDGERVRGDRVFDGSAGEAEWDGFTPYGESTWEGFVPFEEKPGVRNPDYVGTANQRVVDDPEYFVGQGYSSPFRGERIYERLDERVASDQPVDPAFVRDLQLDAFDGRARRLVPEILEARDRMDDRARAAAETLVDWDYRMERDSRAALVFAFFVRRFRNRTWADLDERDLSRPNDWVLTTLPSDDELFDESRADTIAAAMNDAAADVAGSDHEVYGDYNRTDFQHRLQQDFLAYPGYPTDGSLHSVRNVAVERGRGSSWRMVCPMAGQSAAILPGGNDGDYFSEHYDDQLRRWADGEYRPMDLAIAGDTAVQFRGEDG